MVVTASARKHGCLDVDIVHAFRHPVRVFPLDEGLVMVIGGDAAGNLLEVGYVISSQASAVVVHAMPARPKFLRR